MESLLDHRGHAGSVDDESRAVRALYVTVEALREIGEPDADTDTTLVAWEKLQRIAQRWADQEDWVPWFSPHFPVRRLADVLPVA
uniref:Uncharacterized protein n=1 Tax=Streptomyces sp. NBC_00003 TaxID=2903608 RepID=A0AAU2VHT9_9ACTN